MGSSGPRREGTCKSQRVRECGIIRTIYLVCLQFLTQSSKNFCDFLSVGGDRNIFRFNAMTLGGPLDSLGWRLVTRKTNL